MVKKVLVFLATIGCVCLGMYLFKARPESTVGGELFLPFLPGFLYFVAYTFHKKKSQHR